jgi:hypothetical protein
MVIKGELLCLGLVIDIEPCNMQNPALVEGGVQESHAAVVEGLKYVATAYVVVCVVLKNVVCSS